MQCECNELDHCISERISCAFLIILSLQFYFYFFELHIIFYWMVLRWRITAKHSAIKSNDFTKRKRFHKMFSRMQNCAYQPMLISMLHQWIKIVQEKERKKGCGEKHKKFYIYFTRIAPENAGQYHKPRLNQILTDIQIHQFPFSIIFHSMYGTCLA